MTSYTHRPDGLSHGFDRLNRAATAVLAVIILAFAAGWAHAAPSANASDVPSVSVSYADLNLATEEGNLTLYKRIVAAAAQVCPKNTGPGLHAAILARQCVEQAIARAVNDVKSAKLTELQAARTRRMGRG